MARTERLGLLRQQLRSDLPAVPGDAHRRSAAGHPGGPAEARRDELIFLPLFYYLGTTNTAVRKGLDGPTGVKSIFRSDVWNVHTWDLR